MVAGKCELAGPTMIDVTKLIDEMLAEARAPLDDFIAREMSALFAAARGAEFIPGVVQILRQRRAKMIAWRDARLAALELALVVEARRFMRHEMANETPGKIVKFEDFDGHVIATDDKGQRFVTPAGRFDWRPLDPPQPVPPPSRWRRAAA